MLQIDSDGVLNGSWQGVIPNPRKKKKRNRHIWGLNRLVSDVSVFEGGYIKGGWVRTLYQYS